MFPTPDEPQRLTFTLAEARTVLGLGRKAMNALLQTGRLPVIQVSPRKRVISRQALVEFLANPS